MANLNEATASRSKLVAGMAGGAVLLVVLIYLGMGMLASSRAEQRIKEELVEMGQPYALQWDKVSSSPLGGTVKLTGVTLNIEEESPWRGKTYYRANADRLVLKGLNSRKAADSGEVQVSGLEFPSVSDGRSERNRLRRELYQSGLMKGLMLTGRSELAPFDLQAGWNRRKDNLDLTWELSIPDMFKAAGAQRLTGPVERLMDSLDMEGMEANPLAAIMLLASGASRIGLARFDLQVEDLGGIERYNALQQRYMLARREADKPGDAQKAMQAVTQQRCEGDLAEVFTNRNACERLAEFTHGKRSSLKLTASAKEALTFADFERGGMALLKLRLQPELR